MLKSLSHNHGEPYYTNSNNIPEDIAQPIILCGQCQRREVTEYLILIVPILRFRPSTDLIGSDRLAQNLGRKAENQLYDMSHMTSQNQSVYL